MRAFSFLLQAIEQEGRAALVTLSRTEGSTPRDSDACMIVRPAGGFHGTIGGGMLEWDVLQQAIRELATPGASCVQFSHLLGPDLGQCCGGRVQGRIEIFSTADVEEVTRLAKAETDATFRIVARSMQSAHSIREVIGANDVLPDASTGLCIETFGEAATPVWLFGAGHVGRALVLALAGLPFAVTWIDGRDDAFPQAIPSNVSPRRLVSAQSGIKAASTNAFILVMTHSHALDFDIVAAAMGERRFAYIGLIGSGTKRARFLSRLRDLGFDEADFERLTCPVGISGIAGKAPAIIAASIAAQLLLTRQA